MYDLLLQKIVDFIKEIPEDLSVQLGGALIEEGRQSAQQVHNAVVRQKFLEIIDLAHETQLEMETLALCIRSAAMTEAQHNRYRAQIVWTGPEIAHGGIPSRQTGQVLLDLLSGARENVLLAAFAIYKNPPLQQAFNHALDRGVKLTFIVEPKKSDESYFIENLTTALGKRVLKQSEIYFWDRKPDEQEAVMHVKCVIVDDEKLFISSANLTGRAMNHNMELGVLLQGGTEAKMVRQHFEQLIHAKFLFSLFVEF